MQLILFGITAVAFRLFVIVYSSEIGEDKLQTSSFKTEVDEEVEDNFRDKNPDHRRMFEGSEQFAEAKIEYEKSSFNKQGHLNKEKFLAHAVAVSLNSQRKFPGIASTMVAVMTMMVVLICVGSLMAALMFYKHTTFKDEERLDKEELIGRRGQEVTDEMESLYDDMPGEYLIDCAPAYSWTEEAHQYSPKDALLGETPIVERM